MIKTYLRQIHFAIQEKYILKFNTNTYDICEPFKIFQVDSSHAFTEMTIQYLLELEWTARTVLSNLNR